MSSQFSRDEAPARCQPPYGAENVSLGIPAITARHSLLKASRPGPPTACLAVSLPKGRRTRGATFRIVDPMDDLGASSTPVVRQFRAGS